MMHYCTIKNRRSWNIKIRICTAIGVWPVLKERWDLAVEQFQIAITQKSDHAPSHINLGSALAVKERFEGACDVLRRGWARRYL